MENFEKLLKKEANLQIFIGKKEVKHKLKDEKELKEEAFQTIDSLKKKIKSLKKGKETEIIRIKDHDEYFTLLDASINYLDYQKAILEYQKSIISKEKGTLYKTKNGIEKKVIELESYFWQSLGLDNIDLMDENLDKLRVGISIKKVYSDSKILE